VVQPGPGRDRQDVARGLLRLAADLALPLQWVARAGREDFEEEARGDRREARGQAVVRRLLQRQGVLEERLRRRVAQLGDQGRAAADLDVALADLLGVVERMGVEEGPQRVARDPVDRELEVRVLVDGVVTGGEDVLRQLVARLLRPLALLAGLDVALAAGELRGARAARRFLAERAAAPPR